MRRLVVATAICLCVSSAAAIASADTLTLRDGTRVPGTVVAISDRILTFEDWSGISHRYSTNQVESLEFAATTRRDEAAMRDDRRPRDDRHSRAERSWPSGPLRTLTRRRPGQIRRFRPWSRTTSSETPTTSSFLRVPERSS